MAGPYPMDQPAEGQMTETFRPQIDQADIDLLQRMEEYLLTGPPIPPDQPVAKPDGFGMYSGRYLPRHFSEADIWSSYLEDVAAGPVPPPIEPTSFGGFREFPRRLGFDPVELVRSGALECHPCRQNDLINPIHKIFDMANFKNCEPEIYETLKPALRLASLWITHPSCRSFFTTVMFGTRTIDIETSFATKHLHTRVDRCHMEESDEWRYDQHWDIIASNISFVFKASLWDDSCYGTTVAPNITDTWKGPVFPIADPWCMPTQVSLLKDFYTQAAKFAALKHPDEAARLRFYFFAAVNICHELAHAVEYKASSAYFCSLRRYLGDDQFVKIMSNEWFTWTLNLEAIFEDADPARTEMGEAWEQDFFGGRVGPINGRADGLYGMYVFDQPQDASGMRVLYSIPMGYMEEIQQQAFWDVMVPRQRTIGFFRVPKIGASGIGPVSYSTVHLRDYLLYKEAEELGLDDVDEFVDKRPIDTLVVGTTGSADHRQQAEVREAKETVAATYRELIRNIPEGTPHTGSGESPEQAEPNPSTLPSLDKHAGSKSSSGSSSETPILTSVDIATKEPATLTPADKWRLTEEYFCLICNYNSLAFLSLRAAKRLVLPDIANPWKAASWSRPMLDVLRKVRENKGTTIFTVPYQSVPDDENLARIAQKWSWVEELLVYRCRFRREAYAARTGQILDVFNHPEWDPRNTFSWLDQQQDILRKARRDFNKTAHKWALLEEYLRLKSIATTRDEFLLHKYTGRIIFDGDNAKLDPDGPESWGEEQMEMLKRIRYELSAARKKQKWKYFHDSWTLSGRSTEELQNMLSIETLRKALFNRYPQWDPDNPDSWNQEQVEKLQEKLALAFQETGCTPVEGRMVPVSRLETSNKFNIAPSYAAATSRQKKEHEQHEKLQEEKERREALAEVKKATYSTADLAQRLAAQADAEGIIGPDLSAIPSIETANPLDR